MERGRKWSGDQTAACTRQVALAGAAPAAAAVCGNSNSNIWENVGRENCGVLPANGGRGSWEAPESNAHVNKYVDNTWMVGL